MSPGELQVIDSHTHILPDEFRSDKKRWLKADRTFGALFDSPKARTVSAEDLVAEMDGAGVDAAVAAGYGWTSSEAARLSNYYILESAQNHPERIIPFCSVSPLWGPDAINEIERCAADGARGIGELHPDTQGFLHSDFATLAPVMDCARSLDLPVMLHASEPVGHSYPGKGTVTPDLLEALVTAFPSNTFIFAHFGGGLPFYALMPEVKRSLRNCYFDSAAWPFLYEQEVFGVTASAIGHDKVLYGSDYPLLPMSRALSALDSLEHEARAAVSGGNAAALFGHAGA